MPKLSMRPPKLCRKTSNDTGYVYVNGRQVYMGKWGAVAEENYRRFLSDWAARSLPEKQRRDNSFLASDLFARYLEYISSISVYSVSDRQRATFVIGVISELYPGIAVDDFGPPQLEFVRDHILNAGFTKKGVRREYSRQYLNKLTNAIRSIFKWGVSKALVKRETHETLTYVEPLRYRRCSAPESVQRNDARDQDIDAVLPYMLPVYRTMIQLLRLTGMRPSELCRLRKVDIDRSRPDGIWLYTPSEHKTKARGKQRVVPFGAKAQLLLGNWLDKKKDTEFVFSPLDARQEQWELQRMERKTPLTPSQRKRDERNSARKGASLNQQMSVNSLSRAVLRAIEKARHDGHTVESWTPYCVRHQVITEIALLEGPVASQRIAGHSSLNTTDIYNHAALEESVAVAKKYG